MNDLLLILPNRVPIADLVRVCNGEANDAVVARVGDKRAGRTLMLDQLRSHVPSEDQQDPIQPGHDELIPITVRISLHHVARTTTEGGWRFDDMLAIANHEMVQCLELVRSRPAVVNSKLAAQFRERFQEVPIRIPARNSRLSGSIGLLFTLDFEKKPPVLKVEAVHARPEGDLGPGRPVDVVNLQAWFEAEFPHYEVDMSEARISFVVQSIRDAANDGEDDGEPE